MKTVLRIATVEIVQCPELSNYNYLVYKFRGVNSQGVSHLVEVYDDVHEYPEYQLGKYVDNRFVGVLYGCGDPVPEGKFNCGGVFFDVELY